MPFLDTVPRKYLPWKDVTKNILGRAHILPMLNVIFIYKILHKDRQSHSGTLKAFPVIFLWAQNVN